MKYKVSVIVPVYNVAPYLARCLDSLVGQTLQDIEIICIDDKSTDNSLKICREYAKKDKRIRVIALKQNSGAAAARNTGIDAATGEYLGFVDSDDYVDPDFYEKLYSTAKRDNADIAHSNCKITDFQNRTRVQDKELRLIQTHGKWRFIWHWWCGLYNRQMVCKNNIRFPADIISGQDNVFLKECISHANTVALCFDTCYNYVRRRGSLSEQIMPPHKMASRIQAFRLTSDIYNRTSYDNPDDYAFCFADLILRSYDHFDGNTSAECKLSIANLIIELYKDCKDKPRLVEQLAATWSPVTLAYVQSHDATGLYEHFRAQESVAESCAHIPPKNYSIMLFGALPVVQISTSQQITIVKFCGIQIFKLKRANKNHRLSILYLPILRVKAK